MSLSSFRLEPYLVLLSVATALFTVSGLFQGPVSTSMPQALNCTPSGCLIFGVSLLLGIIIGSAALLGIYNGLKRAGYIRPGGHLPHPEPGSGPEETGIITAANQMLSSLKHRRRRVVETVSWSEIQPWYIVHFTRAMAKTAGLILPASLRGKLDDRGWKALLHLNLSVQRMFLPNFAKYVLTIMGPFLLWSVPIFVIQSLYGLQTELTFSHATGPWVGLATLILFFIGTKRLFLRQDLVVAKSIGTAELLNLYQKIDQMKVRDAEKAKTREGWLARLWPVPTITERIRNLEDYDLR